jgi:hypothetical protein
LPTVGVEVKLLEVASSWVGRAVGGSGEGVRKWVRKGVAGVSSCEDDRFFCPGFLPRASSPSSLPPLGEFEASFMGDLLSLKWKQASAATRRSSVIRVWNSGLQASCSRAQWIHENGCLGARARCCERCRHPRCILQVCRRITSDLCWVGDPCSRVDLRHAGAGVRQVRGNWSQTDTRAHELLQNLGFLCSRVSARGGRRASGSFSIDG